MQACPFENAVGSLDFGKDDLISNLGFVTNCDESANSLQNVEFNGPVQGGVIAAGHIGVYPRHHLLREKTLLVNEQNFVVRVLI
jgi:hypothetical protein